MRISLILFILLLSNVAYCCSCPPLGKIDDEQYNEANMIFEGRVMLVINKGMMNEIVFDIKTLFKGEIRSGKVTILSPAQSGTCGIFPRVGENWLIYAFNFQSRFHTNSCARTKNMNSKAMD